jgi:hypothetical protein
MTTSQARNNPIIPPAIRVTKDTPLPRHYIYAGYPDTDPISAYHSFRAEYPDSIPLALYEIGRKRFDYWIPIIDIRSRNDVETLF